MNEEPALERLVDDAHQALRALNHRTIHGAIPAPVLYEVLGRLKQLGPSLDQLLRQLGDGLAESLTEYDVHDEGGGDPATTVKRCRRHLTRAADHASAFGHILCGAQSTITHQGYTVHESTDARPIPPCQFRFTEPEPTPRIPPRS